MTTKRFNIRTPEQLRMLTEFVKADKAIIHIRNFATVWSATRNQRGSTPWDELFAVVFEAERFAGRRAFVEHDGKSLGELRYNAALAFCREQLKMEVDA